jgi:hypothetical protein
MWASHLGSQGKPSSGRRQIGEEHRSSEESGGHRERQTAAENDWAGEKKVDGCHELKQRIAGWEETRAGAWELRVERSLAKARWKI